jgi:hypothetical protein
MRRSVCVVYGSILSRRHRYLTHPKLLRIATVVLAADEIRNGSFDVFDALIRIFKVS